MIELVAPEEMRSWSRRQRAEGKRVGFVPTMGYLHEAHLRLVDRARKLADVVVMSIFVNPLQFGPGEDFERYPRDLERDRAAAAARGVDCLFVPAVRDLYPEPPAVRVVPGPLADHLCGPRRPGHFEGVLTVVTKLFHLVEPDIAVFGRKDAQQAAIIRRMVEDLNFPVAIHVAPTVREADGLALSSRNTYLNPDERKAAAVLARALQAAHQRFRAGTSDAATLCQVVRDTVAHEPSVRLEYVEAVNPRSMAPVAEASSETLLALAAWIGRTRLIDNIVLGEGIGADEILASGAEARD
ncbi:MAG: pantothenate synthetase [Gemmatimonadales bacterium]|nr:MAG: pantothenate synthetase [Gemmatimonadales bacterium]